MHILGYCYEIGKGTRKNIQKAIYWYEKATEFGNTKATDSLKNLKTKLFLEIC